MTHSNIVGIHLTKYFLSAFVWDMWSISAMPRVVQPVFGYHERLQALLNCLDLPHSNSHFWTLQTTYYSQLQHHLHEWHISFLLYALNDKNTCHFYIFNVKLLKFSIHTLTCHFSHYMSYISVMCKMKSLVPKLTTEKRYGLL